MVNESHAGIYRYTVRLQEEYPLYSGLTGNITVSVQDIPTFNHSVEYVKEETGKALCIPITSDGTLLDQPYNTSWTVHRLKGNGAEDKTEINSNSDHFKVSSNGEVLQFHNLSSQVYFTCVVTNEVGNAMQKIILLHRQHLVVCTRGEKDTDRVLSVLKVSTIMQNT